MLQDDSRPVDTPARPLRGLLALALVIGIGTAAIPPGPVDAAVAPQAATTAAEPTTATDLQRALERVVERFPGRIGVHVRHLESDVEAGVDADTPYPMASTYKVPILVELLSRVDAGEWSLDTRIEVTEADQHIGSGLLQDLWAPGISLSVRNLATMMIILSDNSATDMLLQRLGADAVTERMRSLGLDSIRVDRPTLELILDYLGVPADGLESATHQEIEARIDEHESEDEDDARRRFYETPLDVASARHMTELLRLIARGEALTPSSSDLALEIMKRTRTGYGRLRGLLPDDAVVAHKTGTIGRVVDDVGILYLPDDRGRVAISVFTLRDPGADYDDSEEAIADLARTAWDYFLFH